MKRIFLHGLGQGPDSWDETVAGAGGAEDSLCLDLTRLCGAEQTSYARLYAAFSQICDGFGEPLDLCGLSLGAVLALNYAAEHSRKVNSLVLIAAQYKMPKRLLRLQNLVFRLMPDAAFKDTGFGKREFIELCATMSELDFSGALGRIACPTLVLCGERDRANKAAALALADAIGGAELRLIPRCGHEVNAEAPQELSALLSDFYERVGNRQK